MVWWGKERRCLLRQSLIRGSSVPCFTVAISLLLVIAAGLFWLLNCVHRWHKHIYVHCCLDKPLVSVVPFQFWGEGSHFSVLFFFFCKCIAWRKNAYQGALAETWFSLIQCVHQPNSLYRSQSLLWIWCGVTVVGCKVVSVPKVPLNIYCSLVQDQSLSL